jgi:hypothetical protein
MTRPARFATESYGPNSGAWTKMFGQPWDERMRLTDAIDKQEGQIKDALHSFSDLNSYFQNADTNAKWSLTESGAFAAFALYGVGVGLTENAVKTAPGLLGESGSIPTAVWTSSGRVAGIGTEAFSETLQNANAARDIGAIGVGAQAVAPDIARDVSGENGGDAVKRVADPAGSLAELDIKTGNDLSQQTYDTIKGMQHSLKSNLDLYQKLYGHR